MCDEVRRITHRTAKSIARHFLGREGRISTRLIVARGGIRNTMATASATSSG